MRTIFIIPLCLLLSCLISGCNSDNTQKKNKEATTAYDSTQHSQVVEINQAQYQTIGIKLGRLEEKDLKSVVKANGYLKLPPQKFASISTFIGGVVKNIYVIEGDRVQKGQTLATIEHPDFTKLQEDYLKTKDNLKFLRKEYERQKELYSKNVASGKVFQQTEATYESELSRLASLTDQLTKLSISITDLNKRKIISEIPVKTPIDGYVNKININTGSFAEPIKTMLEVVDNSHIHAELMVYEDDWFKVKNGQRILFYLPNEEDKEIAGEVFAVGKSFDPVTRALSLHAEIGNNEKYGLVPGVYINGVIDIGRAKVPALPVDAVVQSGEKSYIFIYKTKQVKEKEQKYIYEMREVKTGVTELNYIEVHPMEKLNLSENIVIKGAYYLLSQFKNMREE